jgi:hypothetical protein
LDTSPKVVRSWCERVMAGPKVNIEDDDYVLTPICKARCNEGFEEGDKVDIPTVYAAIQAKSRRYLN